MKQHLQTILEKEMNRKQFLGYIGAAILAAIGVTGMIKALTHHDSQQPKAGLADHNYGGQSYGGK
jgi:predicted tellurium resistance membrane protein TerC